MESHVDLISVNCQRKKNGEFITRNESDVFWEQVWKLVRIEIKLPQIKGTFHAEMGEKWKKKFEDSVKVWN